MLRFRLVLVLVTVRVWYTGTMHNADSSTVLGDGSSCIEIEAFFMGWTHNS